MADCPHIGTRLLDWLYDELDPPARAQFDMHLHTCVACREAGASLASIRAAMRAWPEEEPVAALSTRLLRVAAREALGAGVWVGWARFHAWWRRGFRLGSMYPALAAAATLVLVAGVVGTLHLRGMRNAAQGHPSPGWATAREHAAPPAAEHAAPLLPAPALMRESESERAGPRGAARQSRAKGEDQAMEIRDEGAGHGVTLDAARVWQGMVTGSPRTRDSKAGEIPGDAPDDQAVPIEKSRATGAVPAQAAGSAADTRPGAAGTPVVGGAPAVPGADERKRDTPQRVADRNELQALHARLRQALRSRACARAVFLGGELRQRDQGYYRRHVAEDEAFAGCVRAERKRARQVAGEHAPAAANE